MISNTVANEYMKGRKRLELDVISAGVAASDSGWQGSVSGSKYSRLYFVVSGGFYIVGEDGERFQLSAGNVYLVPSGYSYSFGCEESMKHIYFHIRLADFDRLDLLERFGTPASARIETDIRRLNELMLSGDRAATLAIECEIYRALSALALLWHAYKVGCAQDNDPLLSSQEAAAALAWNYLLQHGMRASVKELARQFECRKRRMIFYARRMAAVLEKNGREQDHEDH